MFDHVHPRYHVMYFMNIVLRKVPRIFQVGWASKLDLVFVNYEYMYIYIYIYIYKTTLRIRSFRLERWFVKFQQGILSIGIRSTLYCLNSEELSIFSNLIQKNIPDHTTFLNPVLHLFCSVYKQLFICVQDLVVARLTFAFRDCFGGQVFLYWLTN